MPHLFPAYPTFSTSEVKSANSLNVDFGVTSNETEQAFYLYVAFGTSSGILVSIIIGLLLTIWLQRTKINRLNQYFLGRFPDEEEKHRPIIYRPNRDERANHNAVANPNADANHNADALNPIAGANNNHNDDDFEDAIGNQNITHQGAIINRVVDLIFPQFVPGFRNITALKAFQKSQREALKVYQVQQVEIFQRE